MKKRFILWFEDISRKQFDLVGGKNASLGEMTQIGVRVPPGFAVTTHAFNVFLKKSGIGKTIFPMLKRVSSQDQRKLSEVCKEVRNMIVDHPLVGEIAEAIGEAYQKLCEDVDLNDLPVAVRSSATSEDLPWASFAGLQDTYLWIVGVEDVITKVKSCWASLFSDRATSYRNDMGFSHDREKISVTVQKMVNARSAGVMFTLNPINGDRSEIAINASWGLGESVVSGEVTPDEFLVDKSSLKIKKKILGEKHHEIVPVNGGGVVERKVSPERRESFSITEEEIAELIKAGLRIEKHYKNPSDIEWAIDQDMPFPRNIFILQARPETIWSRKKEVSKEEKKEEDTDYVIDLLTRFFK